MSKPFSRSKQFARDVELGLSVGIGAFIVGTLLTARLASLLHDPVAASRSEAFRVGVSGLLRLLSPVAVAPAIAYLGGLLFELPHWRTAVSSLVVFQGLSIAIGWLTLGPATIIGSPFSVAMLVGSTAAGIVLSGLAFKHANRRMRAREAPRAVPQPLSAIDFAAVAARSRDEQQTPAEQPPEPKAGP